MSLKVMKKIGTDQQEMGSEKIYRETMLRKPPYEKRVRTQQKGVPATETEMAPAATRQLTN